MAVVAPLVGITWSRGIVARSSNPGENALRYMELVAGAGMVPMLLVPGHGTDVLDRIDGLLIPGGPDIEPALYGRAPDPRLGAVLPELDALEMTMVRAAADTRVPILGICRGQQLVNVALGGTLHQHLDAHPQWNEDPSGTVHEVRIVAGTHLHDVLGLDRVDVNSGHHQAVDLVAPRLRIAAFSEDGCVEAIEAPEMRIMCVQWHPEEMPDAVSSRRLMTGFAEWVAASGCAPAHGG